MTGGSSISAYYIACLDQGPDNLGTYLLIQLSMVAWTMSLISVHGKTVPIFLEYILYLCMQFVGVPNLFAAVACHYGIPLLTGRCGHVRWLAVRRLWEYEGRWSRPAKTPREHTLNRMRMLACSKFDLDETSNQSKIGGLPRGQQTSVMPPMSADQIMRACLRLRCRGRTFANHVHGVLLEFANGDDLGG